jgi:predicted transcriptional regulator
LGNSRPLAYTTVLTMMRKMEQRGLVAHRTEDRAFIYRPLIDPDQARRSIVQTLLEKVFGGSIESLVAHVLESGEVSPRELARIQKLIRQKERDHGKRKHS